MELRQKKKTVIITITAFKNNTIAGTETDRSFTRCWKSRDDVRCREKEHGYRGLSGISDVLSKNKTS